MSDITVHVSCFKCNVWTCGSNELDVLNEVDLNAVSRHQPSAGNAEIGSRQHFETEHLCVELQGDCAVDYRQRDVLDRQETGDSFGLHFHDDLAEGLVSHVDGCFSSTGLCIDGGTRTDRTFEIVGSSKGALAVRLEPGGNLVAFDLHHHIVVAMVVQLRRFARRESKLPNADLFIVEQLLGANVTIFAVVSCGHFCSQWISPRTNSNIKMFRRTVFLIRRTVYHSLVEREILFTGIGGQGVQLAARTLAEAAMADGRRVQLFASYGGMMRGGNSDSFLVIADRAITLPPVVGTAWAAVVMHHEHAADVWAKLRPDSIAIINDSVVEPNSRPNNSAVEVVEVPALDIASEVGSPLAASLVLVGALVARTDLVSADALLDGAAKVLPSYRSEAAAVNREALAAGLKIGETTHPAWELSVA